MKEKTKEVTKAKTKGLGKINKMKANDIFIDWTKLEDVIAKIDAKGEKTREWLDNIALKTLKRKASKDELFENAMDPKKGPILVALVDEDTLEKIKTVIDFLNTAEKFGSIQPKKLAMLQITEEKADEAEFSTLDVDKLVKRHDDWVTEFNMLTREFSIRLGPEDERIIYRNGDEYLVELTSKKAMVEEGNLMGHCIGSHDNYNTKRKEGSAKYYSLRKNGESHVTFEISTKDNAILQTQGKGNRPPVSKYLRSISEAIAFMNWNPGHLGLDRTGVTKGPNGRWYSIFNLPEEIGEEGSELMFPNISNIESFGNVKKIHGSFTVEKCEDFESLGNLEVVTGKLIVNKCKNFKTLGALKEVGGGLEIIDCPAFNSIPRLEKIGDYADFNGSAIENLGPLKTVGGYLCLVGCKSLVSIDHLVDVGGQLDLEGCEKLTTVSELTRVGKGIDIIGCKSLKDFPKIKSVAYDLEDQDSEDCLYVYTDKHSHNSLVDMFRNMGLRIDVIDTD